MLSIFNSNRVKLPTISSREQLEREIRRLGFLPMFANGIRGFSIYESTPGFWSGDGDGPWEWKGPIIRSGEAAYGKFFSRKAGYVSRQWLGDFLNYRRTLHLAPNDDAAALDDIVLQTVDAQPQITIKELREVFGLSRRRRRPGELVDDFKVEVRLNLDTNLTRLMMEGRIAIADFVYNVDKRGNAYGWGIARYATPEYLYGADVVASCLATESYTRMLAHLASRLPGVPEAQLRKLL